MKYTITERKVSINDKTRERLHAKLDKFEKFFKTEAEVFATFENQKDWIYLEITIRSGDLIIRAEADDQEARGAIDKAVEIIEGQLRKYKTKMEKKVKQNAYESVFDADTLESEEEETEFRVVKSKKFFMKPMSVEEAILQMNLLNHSFFIFTNAETDGTNVVYKRKDQNYCLIEID